MTDPAEGAAGGGEGQRSTLRGAVVLIVDDDAAVLEVTKRVLERVGCYVLQAREPAAALQLARDHRGRLDLVLTDVTMSGMNGRELGERLAVERPDTRLLYMSAYAEDEAFRRGVAAKGRRFISKPFSLEGLALAVREALAD